MALESLRAGVKDIELLLVGSGLRWLGQVARMENNRPTKALLYGEPANGTREIGRPKLRYKDTCKNALKCGGAINEWKGKAAIRTEWRKLVHNTCTTVDENRKEEYERRRGKKKT